MHICTKKFTWLALRHHINPYHIETLEAPFQKTSAKTRPLWQFEAGPTTLRYNGRPGQTLNVNMAHLWNKFLESIGHLNRTFEYMFNIVQWCSMMFNAPCQLSITHEKGLKKSGCLGQQHQLRGVPNFGFRLRIFQLQRPPSNAGIAGIAGQSLGRNKFWGAHLIIGSDAYPQLKEVFDIEFLWNSQESDVA